DVADAGLDLVVVAEVALDLASLRGRLHDHELACLGHPVLPASCGSGVSADRLWRVHGTPGATDRTLSGRDPVAPGFSHDRGDPRPRTSRHDRRNSITPGPRSLQARRLP